jgi:hypothetical protein
VRSSGYTFLWMLHAVCYSTYSSSLALSELHGVISEEAEFVVTSAVRSSNLICKYSVHVSRFYVEGISDT